MSQNLPVGAYVLDALAFRHATGSHGGAAVMDPGAPVYARGYHGSARGTVTPVVDPGARDVR